MIEAEIKKARKAKAEHSGERRKEKRVIGFCVQSHSSSAISTSALHSCKDS